MANTIIKLPFLEGDLAYSVDVISTADLSILQANIALTVVDGIHQGVVSAALAGQFIFQVSHSGDVVESRVRTIADDAGPYTILTGLDSTATQTTGELVTALNPSDGSRLSTGFGFAYDQVGQLENGVAMSIQLAGGAGVSGESLDTAPRTVVTTTVTVDGANYDGYFEFPGLRIGATYTHWRGQSAASAPSTAFGSRTLGNSARQTIIIPDSPSFALAETLGAE